MKKSRFSESQIIKILKEGEVGIPVQDVARKNGISVATFYNWRTKFGGMTMSHMKRLRDLEQETSRLKRMYADVCLDNLLLKDIVEKKF